MKQFKLAYILAFMIIAVPFSVHVSCEEPEIGQSPIGPFGPTRFKPDVGSLLSFTNAFEPGGALPSGSILIPYVVAPNGVVIQGTPVTADGTLTDYIFSPILVSNPVFGTYHTGVQVTLSADFTPGLINLTSKVISDRAGPATAEITVVGEEDTLSPVFPLLAGNQYQVTADFAYGQANIP